MKLIALKLRNFKGIKGFALYTRGGDVSVSGDNSTGKTTVYDAFLWLLFDKDSQNSKDFEIKTLAPDGNVIHGLEHEVEGEFETGSGRIVLRKVYSETFTKKRGSAEKVFTGNSTDCWVNGVPVKKAEYAAAIAQIMDESLFRLLTSPTYFNEQLHWADRRKLLMEICGDISDADVIASAAKLAKLPAILGGRKLDDHKKVISARRAEINKELDKIPVRIDEATRALPDIAGIDPAAVQEDIARARAAQNELRQELSRIENGGEIAEQRKRMAEVETELIGIENRHIKKLSDINQTKRTESGVLASKMPGITSEIVEAKRRLQRIALDREAGECTIKRKREAWNTTNAQQFEFEQSDTCPACGQYLPREKLEEARGKALAAFNQTKAEELARISGEGKEIGSKLNDLVIESINLVAKVADLEKQLNGITAERDRLQAEITDLMAETQAYTTDPAYAAKAAEKAAIEAAIAKLQDGSYNRIGDIDHQIMMAGSEIASKEIVATRIKQHADGQSRIAELAAQQKTLATEYERLEGELYLTEQFVRTKVSLLEGKINSRFKLARFRLFEEQVNGGLTDTCQTTYNGVPYSDLNHGGKLNIGLDIIATLIDHYGFSAPVFVDNAEAVTALLPIPAQTIRLVVSEPDKQLRVVCKNDEQNLFGEVNK